MIAGALLDISAGLYAVAAAIVALALVLAVKR